MDKIKYLYHDTTKLYDFFNYLNNSHKPRILCIDYKLFITGCNRDIDLEKKKLSCIFKNPNIIDIFVFGSSDIKTIESRINKDFLNIIYEFEITNKKILQCNPTICDNIDKLCKVRKPYFFMDFINDSFYKNLSREIEFHLIFTNYLDIISFLLNNRKLTNVYIRYFSLEKFRYKDSITKIEKILNYLITDESIL